MELTIGDRAVRPLTADEVLRMVEAGILPEDERVELLHGALTEMSPKSPAHATVVTRLGHWLVPVADAGRFEVRSQLPLVVPDPTSLPEPDIAVVVPGDYTRRHPSTALLVVEVAVTSLRTDTTIKPVLYAAAGVPELVVVDVPARRLTVLTEPAADGYARAQVLDEGPSHYRPASVDVAALELRALFAGLP